MNPLRKLYHDDRGATAIEYGMILAMIVIAIMLSLNGMADQINALWSTVSDKVVTARDSPPL